MVTGYDGDAVRFEVFDICSAPSLWRSKGQELEQQDFQEGARQHYETLEESTLHPGKSQTRHGD